MRRQSGRLTVLVSGLAVAVVTGTMALAAWLTAPPSAPLAAELEALELRVEQAPADGEGWKQLGRSYLARGQLAAATGAFSRAAELLPRDPEVNAALQELAAIARASQRHRAIAR